MLVAAEKLNSVLADALNELYCSYNKEREIAKA